ncbi:glyoxalase [Aestuariivivens sediminicola]|uniref:glyoxalase n=1 Tax=Aestuariivivens sediminicola TaxID=2913560 RepID=UPI001F5784DF|nr:glyoxalase [Aestuariivivens sediminicola]
MNTRDLSLKQMRPEILTATINDNMSSEERFQNLVLRPVIKLQNGLLIAAFRNYILKHKSVFYGLTLQKRMDYIENAIHKDMKFRNSLKGMVLGQFTLEEYSLYIENSCALNKRMMNLVKERLLSNIQLFEKPELLTAV